MKQRTAEKVFIGLMVASSVLLVAGMALVHARDAGQWEQSDPATRRWFQNLKQPDNPNASCCGEADAYYADSFEVEGDHYVAIITDERDDAPLGRAHIEVGTKIVVPNYKIKFDDPNPTGHGIIFLQAGSLHVWCFLAPGGV